MQFIQKPKDGDFLNASLTMYPSRLSVITQRHETEDQTTTSYGYVVSGHAHVSAPGLRFRGDEGAFFCIPGGFHVDSRGQVVIIERLGYRGLLLAGRIEDRGRLTYIDGCSSTILALPARAGDPVLNHLHIPPGINQSQHTHPSLRLGVIARGRGLAYGRSSVGNVSWEEPLEIGTIFLLDSQEQHSFSTASGCDSLDVITFHPDSDWGPTDGDHPMLSRTFLRGK